jgi:hypothetical protein
MNDAGFLSKDITVMDLLLHRGDIHHLFPKDLLKKSGYSRGDYNQIANYALTQQEINIKIGNKAPADYMGVVKKQTSGGPLTYGGISSESDLKKNLEANCIPTGFTEMTINDYEEFLKARRKLIANKIKSYYFSL